LESDVIVSMVMVLFFAVIERSAQDSSVTDRLMHSVSEEPTN